MSQNDKEVMKQGTRKLLEDLLYRVRRMELEQPAPPARTDGSHDG